MVRWVGLVLMLVSATVACAWTSGPVPLGSPAGPTRYALRGTIATGSSQAAPAQAHGADLHRAPPLRKAPPPRGHQPPRAPGHVGVLSTHTIVPFLGSWVAHGANVTVDLSGGVVLLARTYTTCTRGVAPPCDRRLGTTITWGIQLRAHLQAVQGDQATVLIMTSTIPHTVGRTLSLHRLPHQRLDLHGPTTWLHGLHLCNETFFNTGANYKTWWDCGV